MAADKEQFGNMIHIHHTLPVEPAPKTTVQLGWPMRAFSIALASVGRGKNIEGGKGEKVWVGLIWARSLASVSSVRVCSSKDLASVRDLRVCPGWGRGMRSLKRHPRTGKNTHINQNPKNLSHTEKVAFLYVVCEK